MSRALQPFCHFTYVRANSPTLPSLHLRHSAFSNPSFASPTSQLIVQPFFRFSYVTGSSLMSPGEPPMKQTDCSLTSLNYSRYHHYHKRTAMYCNYIVHDIATFSLRCFALWLEILKLYLHNYIFFG